MAELKDQANVLCKWNIDEICCNADCPMCTEYCPVSDIEGVCKHENRKPTHKIQKCLQCGVEMRIKIGSPKKYCTSCAQKRKHARSKAWNESHKNGVGSGGTKWEWSDASIIDKTPVKHEDIAGDERKARAAGLSYGQWRALQKT